MPNGASGKEPKLPISSLPEMIDLNDLAGINEALAVLFA
jgi:hypothetical protein